MLLKDLELTIRKMKDEDFPQVAAIYQKGLETGIATFETEIPSWKSWDQSHLKTGRFVAQFDGRLAGWAALSPVSSRCVYGGVAEVSVYVDPAYQRKGIASKLMQELIDESEKEGLWTLQSGIFPQNKSSINLHLKLGFREIGYREKIGKKAGVWHDNILLERRSKKIGIN